MLPNVYNAKSAFKKYLNDSSFTYNKKLFVLLVFVTYFLFTNF